MSPPANSVARSATLAAAHRRHRPARARRCRARPRARPRAESPGSRLRIAARPADRRAHQVDQPPVLGDVRVEAVLERLHPADRLRPDQVGDPGGVGVVAGQAQAGEVGAGEAEGGGVAARVAERDVLGRGGARRGEEAVEAADEARGAGVRVEVSTPWVPSVARSFARRRRGGGRTAGVGGVGADVDRAPALVGRRAGHGCAGRASALAPEPTGLPACPSRRPRRPWARRSRSLRRRRTRPGRGSDEPMTSCDYLHARLHKELSAPLPEAPLSGGGEGISRGGRPIP